jgi:dolichol kinase
VLVTPSAERMRGVQPWRRLFHAGNGLVVAFFPPVLGLEKRVLLLILSSLLVVLLAFDLVRLRVPGVNAFFFKAFPSLASPREAKQAASSTWYACGVVIAYAFFPVRIAVPAIVVLALADPMASVVGRLWGRRRVGNGTVLGSLVFLFVAFAVLSAFFGPAAAMVPALVVTCVEVVPWRLDDNLTVVVAGATALCLMGV